MTLWLEDQLSLSSTFNHLICLDVHWRLLCHLNLLVAATFACRFWSSDLLHLWLLACGRDLGCGCGCHQGLLLRQTIFVFHSFIAYSSNVQQSIPLFSAEI